jgi:hypothetical protein
MAEFDWREHPAHQDRMLADIIAIASDLRHGLRHVPFRRRTHEALPPEPAPSSVGWGFLGGVITPPRSPSVPPR